MARTDLGDVAVKALTRPGIGSALLAGLGVYVVLAFQSLLGTIVYVITDGDYAQDVGAYLGLILQGTIPAALGTPLPFAIGVVLAFWQIAPIVPQLRMAHVVTRALLAAGVGAAVAAVTGFIVTAAGGLTAGLVATSLGRFLFDTARSVLPGALTLFIDGLVVVPLAALLLWGWLQSHPPKSTARGALDEV
jgi:hypothetical protein